MALARSLATKATRSAISCGSMSRAISEVGRFSRHEPGLGLLVRQLREQVLHERLDPVRPGRPGEDRVHRDVGALREFGKVAGNGQLHRLGRAVVRQFGCRRQGRLAGDENDAAGTPFEHALDEMPAEPDAAHDVDAEQPEPFVIGGVDEVHRHVDAEVVDQDVDLAQFRDEQRASVRGAGVGGHPADVSRGVRRENILRPQRRRRPGFGR